MIGALARALVCCSTALVAVLIAAAPVQADDCNKCTHQGKPVQCPPGLPPGSRSVEFVPGGAQWVTPTGANVFVAQTTFPVCPTTAPPAAPPSSAGTPPPATSSSPPPDTQPPPPSTQAAPKGPPRGQAPPTVQPGDLGRVQQERARGLIEGGPSQPLIPVTPGPAGPGLPGQSTEEKTDEAIGRLGRLLQQQPPTTQEKPPEPPAPSVPADQPVLTPPRPPQTSRGSKDELAELEIKKEQAAAMDPVELGRSVIKYTITVTNKGPAAALNVVVADYMMEERKSDESGTFITWDDAAQVKVAKDATSDNSAASAQITKDDKGNFVSGNFKLASLAKGGQWTITYQVEPTLARTLVNGVAFKCDNLKRGWRKEFTLWTVKNGVAQDLQATWRSFERKDASFKWAVDAAFTEAKVVPPSKKP